ncbi:MAG: CAP domain-containing protein [Pseudomonadota bacterium]
MPILIALALFAAQDSEPRGDALLKAVMLRAHNAARAAVKVPPVAWDDALAADARAYAAEMAASGRFEHAVQLADKPHQGENLWEGTIGAYGYAEMADAWVREKRWFVNLPAPGFSTTGDGHDVGHYTQMIWSRTRHIGCALASGGGRDYLVCRYAAPGNMLGQTAIPTPPPKPALRRIRR